MKQHITPKQAKEITRSQFYFILGEAVDRDDWANFHHRKVTIGKMIEFLEINEWNINISKANSLYRVSNDAINGWSFSRKGFCDALWEAVKNVLNK